MSGMLEIEATVDRISSHQGVIGLMVVLSDGTVIRSTFNNEETTRYAKLLIPFALLTVSSVRDVDP